MAAEKSSRRPTTNERAFEPTRAEALLASHGRFAAAIRSPTAVNVFLGVLVVAAFAGIAERARLPAHVRVAVQRARESYAVVSDRSLTDDQKERRLREETPRLMALLGRIVFGSLLALALPLGVLWALDRIGLISLPDVLDVLVRVDFLLVVSALGILVFWMVRRRRSGSSHTLR